MQHSSRIQSSHGARMGLRVPSHVAREGKMKGRICSIFAGIVLGFALLTSSAMAQVTTGTVTGRVVDSTGGIVPNARVVLVSEARGTRSAGVLTNESGDYVLANITADTYTIEVTAPSFKTLKRTGILVT